MSPPPPPPSLTWWYVVAGGSLVSTMVRVPSHTAGGAGWAGWPHISLSPYYWCPNLLPAHTACPLPNPPRIAAQHCCHHNLHHHHQPHTNRTQQASSLHLSVSTMSTCLHSTCISTHHGLWCVCVWSVAVVPGPNVVYTSTEIPSTDGPSRQSSGESSGHPAQLGGHPASTPPPTTLAQDPKSWDAMLGCLGNPGSICCVAPSSLYSLLPTPYWLIFMGQQQPVGGVKVTAICVPTLMWGWYWVAGLMSCW